MAIAMVRLRRFMAFPPCTSGKHEEQYGAAINRQPMIYFYCAVYWRLIGRSRKNDHVLLINSTIFAMACRLHSPSYRQSDIAHKEGTAEYAPKDLFPTEGLDDPGEYS
jgi:hypothetical protein